MGWGDRVIGPTKKYLHQFFRDGVASYRTDGRTDGRTEVLTDLMVGEELGN